jgi:hypothetical protein
MDIRVSSFPNAVRYETNYWAKICLSVMSVRYEVKHHLLTELTILLDRLVGLDTSFLKHTLFLN